MLNFIINSSLYKIGSIKTNFLNELNLGEGVMAILKEYQLKDKSYPNIVLQWKWRGKMPKPKEAIYEEDEDGFEELKKCEQMELVIKNNIR